MTNDPNQDEFLAIQARGFIRRLDPFEESIRTVIDGLKEHDDRLDGIETNIDEKIKEFKDNLLFNEISDIEGKIDTHENELRTLNRQLFGQRILILDLWMQIDLHNFAHVLPLPDGASLNLNACVAELQTLYQHARREWEISNDEEGILTRLIEQVNQTLQAYGYPQTRIHYTSQKSQQH